MRLATLGAIAAMSIATALVVGWPGAALAQASCIEHRMTCDSMCTPRFVAFYHGGSLRRCTASCEPRMQECLRTGIWVDLERLSSGGREAAPPF